MLDFYPRGYVMPEHASLYLNVANPEVSSQGQPARAVAIGQRAMPFSAKPQSHLPPATEERCLGMREAV